MFSQWCFGKAAYLTLVLVDWFAVCLSIFFLKFLAREQIPGSIDNYVTERSQQRGSLKDEVYIYKCLRFNY
ncbi:hypothetical protein SAMN05421784_13317 [Xenorhabdus koppenhoeferi]|uniref:Uncharacterized protein n=1 Tax=Xenorhabdus koppenhoeferi TaxID=351659 RepID=A0A1I7JID4_9GAMM|nr:hypothetical protein SAMN05421784_13317 [Xenorhabdus koppenhoeferi]